MTEKVHCFRELIVWQKGILLAKETYSLTAAFPPEEKFGIISQMRRAATSVPANIAEGWSRKHTREYIQFIHIAIGSLAELETFLEISKELGYVRVPDESDSIMGLIHELQKMLYSMDKSLSSRNCPAPIRSLK
ncbi:MAG: four helix bundle protein [Elusimicrobia bacterium]|nr:four helix bundle protein [Elusimicrobiota bacterium]